MIVWVEAELAERQFTEGSGCNEGSVQAFAAVTSWTDETLAAPEPPPAAAGAFRAGACAYGCSVDYMGHGCA